MQQDAHEFLNFLINHINEIIVCKYNFKRKFRKFSVKFKIFFLQRKGVRITIIPNQTSPIATKPTKNAKILLGSVTF